MAEGKLAVLKIDSPWGRQFLLHSPGWLPGDRRHIGGLLCLSTFHLSVQDCCTLFRHLSVHFVPLRIFSPLWE
jgi:hypothetical protein